MLAVVLAPVVVSTTINTLALALGAAGLLLYGRTRLPPVSGAGVVLVLLELETVWNTHHLAVEIGAAVSGVALLAAFELRSWTEELEETPADPASYRAHARTLASRLAIVAGAVAVLVFAARGVGHGPAFGIAAGLAALGLGACLLRLAARPVTAELGDRPGIPGTDLEKSR